MWKATGIWHLQGLMACLDLTSHTGCSCWDSLKVVARLITSLRVTPTLFNPFHIPPDSELWYSLEQFQCIKPTRGGMSPCVISWLNNARSNARQCYVLIRNAHEICEFLKAWWFSKISQKMLNLWHPQNLHSCLEFCTYKIASCCKSQKKLC